MDTLVRRITNTAAAMIGTLALQFALFSQPPVSAQNIYIQHNLVSDVPGLADVTDPNLVNPWGVSISAASPFWVSNQGKGNTTLYNGSGAITNLVVTIPGPGGAPSKPTGQVNNGSTQFILANGNRASFMFATENGTIDAWNGGGVAQLMVDNSGSGAVYKGLAINNTGALLYAANFNAGKIDVFDGKFAPTTVPGGFNDPNLPSGFAPFNIWFLGGKLYVTYAKQDAAKHDDVPGPGNGYVDVFDLNGNLQKRIVSGGQLNSPWGVAIAPAVWGAFGGALLVGNFGDGKINAFDLNTGNFLGALQDKGGKPIAIEGLWAILFGNGRNGGDTNTLYFAAGISNGDVKTHGLFGALAPPTQVLSLKNGASQISGSVAPGEVVVVNGFTIGPSPLAAGTIPASGKVGTTVAATGVTFNSTPAPVLYASASATSVIVPYEVTGSTANVVVTFKDQTTAAFLAQVVPSAPGLFTLDTTGSGAVVAFNQDGTLNGANNAAAAGSIVVLYATGEGQPDAAGQDGEITGRILRQPMLPVSLTIGGQTAKVIYSGSAPGLVAGVMQVEAIVPSGAGSGAVPVLLTVGTATSQQGATLNVK